MLTDHMIAHLRREERESGSLVGINTAVDRMPTEDRTSLIEAINACIRTHENAGRRVAGGLFMADPGFGYSRGLVGVAIFAVGPTPDAPLRHCYVTAELPGIEVSDPMPKQGYSTDELFRYGLPLDISRALTGRVSR